MQIEKDFIKQLDLAKAARQELASRTRLMPRREDFAALEKSVDEIVPALMAAYRRGLWGFPAAVLLADKNKRGRRPLSEMSLTDRVLYRALVNRLAASLPETSARRVPFANFATAPLAAGTAKYVSKTDVTAFYEFVDHDQLILELESQTGDGVAIDILAHLLHRVMGRRVGLPQVHKSSDVLGDTYIDIARRRLRRAGIEVWTYSDDFRIATSSLEGARDALEECAGEVRKLGLALNEAKTFTYGVDKYRASLEEYREAERNLFSRADVANSSLPGLILLLTDAYEEEEDEEEVEEELASDDAETLGPALLPDEVPDEEHNLPDQADGRTQIDDGQKDAATKAISLWLEEQGSTDTSSAHEIPVSEILVGRALGVLGLADDPFALDHVSRMLRNAPGITPNVASYLISLLSSTRKQNRKGAYQALRDLCQEKSFGVWQQIWIAHTAGQATADKPDDEVTDWLNSQIGSRQPGLAAFAMLALAARAELDADRGLKLIDRIGDPWRSLAFFAVASVDPARLDTLEEGIVDGVLLTSARQDQGGEA